MNPLRLPVPNPRQAAVLVLVALSAGVVTGRALDAAAADDAPALLAKTPAAADEPAAPTGAGGGTATLSAPPGNVEPEPAPEVASTNQPAASPSPAAEPSEPLTDAPPADTPADTPEQSPDRQAERTRAVTGAVVLVNPAAHGYALATAEGKLIAVHSSRLPRGGALVEAQVTRLANGTRKEARRTAVGSDPSAKVRGTVTFVAADQPSYVVSALGASLLVHSAPGRPLPALLDLVTVQVGFADTPFRLLEESLQVGGRASGPVDLHGTIQSVDPVTRTVVIGADDLRESGLDLPLLVPEELDLEALEAASVIAATAELQPDGSYRLATAGPDKNARVANRPD